MSDLTQLSEDDDSIDGSYSSQEYESAEEGVFSREIETPAFVNTGTQDTFSSGRVRQTLNLESAIAVQYFRMLYDAGELVPLHQMMNKLIVLAFRTDEEFDYYHVTVSGSEVADVDKCVQQMKSMLDIVLSEDGHTYTLLPLWTKEHVLALRGSTKLASAQRRFGAVCRFITHHSRQKVVHIKVAGSTSTGVQGLVSFIKEMRPRYVYWVVCN